MMYRNHEGYPDPTAGAALARRRGSIGFLAREIANELPALMELRTRKPGVRAVR